MRGVMMTEVMVRVRVKALIVVIVVSCGAQF